MTHANHQPVLRNHHPDVLARTCATSLSRHVWRDIRTLVIKGSLPKRAQALEWAALHRIELMRGLEPMLIETATQEHRPAGVIAVAPWRVRAVSARPGCRLSITCNDGTSGVDMSALVNNSGNGGVYAALKDAQLFQQVSIELEALTWPNGSDLDPSVLI